MGSKASGQLISIKTDSVSLEGELIIPKNAIGLVIFVHGSGSSRQSPRNKFVAEVLQKEGIATLLFDLLTEDEDANYANRFDIGLLVERLLAATTWVAKQSKTKNLALGYFGASTGAAAALQAAATLGKIKAVVSRGGRPDLAWDYLAKVKAATLLIVGENDETVLELNQKALREIAAEKKLEIVTNATHLFEEPGSLEKVAGLAAEWFKKYLI